MECGLNLLVSTVVIMNRFSPDSAACKCIVHFVSGFFIISYFWSMRITSILIIAGLLWSCNKDGDGGGVAALTGDATTYEFWQSEGYSGTVTFAKRTDNSTEITLDLNGPNTTGPFPAFLIEGSVATPKSPLLILTEIENGESVTNVSTLTDGTVITYDELINFDGHVSVFESFNGAQIVFAEIGANELTSTSTLYNLRDNQGGDFGTFEIIQRKSGSAAALIETNEDGTFPVRFLDQTLIDDGNVLITLNDIRDGMSYSDLGALDNGSSVTYAELIAMDGNIRILEDDIDFDVIAGADLGGNTLTGETKSYDLPSLTSENIGGTAFLEERANGSTLVTIEMMGTSGGVNHATHIHQGNALDGGSIIISFNSISGSNGISKTNITQMDDGTTVTFDDLLEIDGHIVVHPGTGQFNILAKGDIGTNELSGEFEEYEMVSQTGDNISGVVLFKERKNGFTLVEMELTGTTPGENHATHIHRNSLLTGGPIEISFNDVVGETGVSQTNVTKRDDGTSITYEELLTYNGHIMVHPNSNQLNIVARADIGENVLTGESKTYELAEVGSSGVSGTVTFHERRSGKTMIALEVTGASPGNTHPNHIHENSAASGGSIVLDFRPVDGDTGVSTTDAYTFNDGTTVTYAELITFNGHVIVHHHSTFAAVARGDIGSNVQ